MLSETKSCFANIPLLFIAFLFLQINTLAQEGWCWQNPLPQNFHLTSVDFVDELTGWAVGGGGTILKTTDGGTTWIKQTSGTGTWLNSVSFTDSDNGTIVGGTGGFIWGWEQIILRQQMAELVDRANKRNR